MAMKHGHISTYVNHGCHCAPCTEANRGYRRMYKQRRAAQRVLIDGRLVAPGPPERHGRASTYDNWSCRCAPCTTANSEHSANQRKRHGGAT